MKTKDQCLLTHLQQLPLGNSVNVQIQLELFKRAIGVWQTKTMDQIRVPMRLESLVVTINTTTDIVTELEIKSVLLVVEMFFNIVEKLHKVMKVDVIII